MNEERFAALVQEALDSLPAQFRTRLHNVAVVVADRPSPEAERSRGGTERGDLLLGLFEGVPQTERSFFELETGPARIVLFRKNIETYAREAAREQHRPLEDVIREEVRLTVLHELGHYFGMSEAQLEDV
ncbi:MAG: metallopeptidase family protein [Acidobacteriia bacterium]|jgi:predicted Zn-dependent protease with MMP-like domain|nr:metallopeptidase family protein [Terriglobia bacterium]